MFVGVVVGVALGVGEAVAVAVGVEVGDGTGVLVAVAVEVSVEVTDGEVLTPKSPLRAVATIRQPKAVTRQSNSSQSVSCFN